MNVQGHTVSPNGNYFHRYSVSPGAEMYCMTPNGVETPVASDTGELPAAVPSGVVSVVWEMALDRVPPAMLTFSNPRAWLSLRMKVQKGRYYKLARAT